MSNKIMDRALTFRSIVLSDAVAGWENGLRYPEQQLFQIFLVSIFSLQPLGTAQATVENEEILEVLCEKKNEHDYS